MKNTFLTLVLCLISTLSFAQSPALQWQKCFGGTDSDNAKCIQPTPDGGYIVAGYIRSNNGDITGFHGTGYVYNDAWIVKISASGAIMWQKTLGGTNIDRIYSIQNTPDGGYIMAGYTMSTDGDVTINHGLYDFWVVKLNSTGTIVWQKCFGGTNGDKANSIQNTPDGGYIVAGNTDSNDIDVTGSHGNTDCWVVKLSATGTIVWQKALGGTVYDYAESIQPTPDGGYIMAGSTASTDGDVTGTHGYYDVWVVKLGATGDLLWQKTLGGYYEDRAYSIQPTPDGGYIVAGQTFSNDGDITGSHGNSDCWVVKLNATGTIEWQKALGGTAYDYAENIQLTPDGGYIMTCYIESNDGDVIGYYQGNGDAWVVKLGATGTIEWQKVLGGSTNDWPKSIQITSDGGYIVAGQTSSNDGNVTGNHGYHDYWVFKLGADLSTAFFENQAIVIYPNPAKDQITLTFTETPSPFEVSIADGLGKTVFSQTYSAQNNVSIATAAFSKGVYFLTVSNQDKKQTQKLIID